MATEQLVRELVRRNKGGAIEGCYGPARIAQLNVWEVWTHDRDEYATRFVLESRGEELSYFSSFGELCAFLDKVYGVPDIERIKQSERSHASRVRLYVGASVFVASAAALLYLVIVGKASDRMTFGVFASLIASGGAVFYGAWKQQKLLS